MDLRIWRQAKGWTQEELAKRLGVTPVTISRYESKKRAPPSNGRIMRGLMKLSKGAVTPNDFMVLDKEAI